MLCKENYKAKFNGPAFGNQMENYNIQKIHLKIHLTKIKLGVLVTI